MATGGQTKIDCSLVDVGDLKLENTDVHPFGIVVSGDMLMVTDYDAWNVQLYRRYDGKLLATSGKLESRPFAICFIHDTEICVAVKNGTIEIMSVGDTGVVTKGRTLHVNTSFDSCHGVARFMDKVVVCGVKQDSIYWCIVPLNDGHVDKTHRICKGGLSNLTTKDNMIYISCDDRSDNTDTGVYGYDIQNPSKHTFIYKHESLNAPSGITVDTQEFVFVCNKYPPCIHRLTDKCELVTIYRGSAIPNSPLFISWDHGILYVTSLVNMEVWWNNAITRYKPNYSHQQGDHKGPELRDEIKQPVFEEITKHIEPGIRRQRRIRVRYEDSSITNFEDGNMPVKCIEVRQQPVLETGTFASMQHEDSTSSRKGVYCLDPKLLCQVLNESTKVASSSRSTLERNCLTVGLEFHGETPGNGNCFFEAVSSQLQRLNYSVQKSPQQLRSDVVTFMKTNRVLQVSEGTIDLAEFLHSETFENYCIRMANDGEWADHVVVVGMARMLRTDIMIVTSAPSSGPDGIIVWVIGQPNFQEKPILIGHIWEHHYQSLQPIGDHKAQESQVIYQRNQLVSEDPYTQTEQGVEKMDSVEEKHLSVSDQTKPEECKTIVQRRPLPNGKEYHAFFSYSSSDILWVKKTVETLENDHGFVCCEYERNNKPGTPLLKFADDSIKNAYKTVVVMTREAFQSGFVLLEIQMAMNQGFSENRNCVVPVLLEDCEIPGYLRVLNYVDARDPERRDIWLPKLLMELETQAKHESSWTNIFGSIRSDHT